VKNQYFGDTREVIFNNGLRQKRKSAHAFEAASAVDRKKRKSGIVPFISMKYETPAIHLLSFCWKVKFFFGYSLLLSVFDGFFPCALIILVKLELFVVKNNYYPVAFPEVRVPAGQDVLL